MQLTIRWRGEDHVVDVEDGESIAEAAAKQGIPLLGACQGKGICCLCSRRIAAGIEKLLNTRTGEPVEHGPHIAPFTRTCQSTPTEEGVVVDADRPARLW